MSEIKPTLHTDWLGTIATCDPVNCEHCLEAPDSGTACVPYYRAALATKEEERRELLHKLGDERLETQTAQRERDAARVECERIFAESEERHIEALKTLSLAAEACGAWAWNGNEEDHLESMSNGMAVLISAGQLRALLAESQTEMVSREKLEEILKRSENRVYQAMDEYDRADLCALLSKDREPTICERCSRPATAIAFGHPLCAECCEAFDRFLQLSESEG